MSDTLRRAVAFAVLVFAARAAAEAPPPPPRFALPDGIAQRRVEYRSYAWLNVDGKEVQGRRWIVDYVAPPGAKPSLVVPSLRAQGWEIVKAEPIVVAHVGDGEWLLSTSPGTVKIVEKGAGRRIDLAPPGATPEEFVKDQDPPYFTPYAGLRRTRWELSAKSGCEVQNPVIKDVKLAGPPSLRLLYQGAPEDVTGLELQEGYVDALARAGWDVVVTGRANNTTAHYAKQGRDLWLHFAPEDGYLNVCIADVGAAAAEAKLKRALDEIGHVAVYGIYFDVDKATLRPEAEATLAQIRALLAKYGDLALEIQGHTDNTGTHAHNATLSADRAASVKAWLVAHGIAAARLTTAGYGETRPVATNATVEGRQLNRRVELAKR